VNRIWIGILLAACAPGQDTFHIAGTVVNSQTGQPVKGAVVTLRGRVQFEKGTPEAPKSREALTDAGGRFSVDELPSGGFTVSAEKNGYVTTWVAGGELTVGPSKDGVAVSLTPLGVISGRVMDEEGEPVVFASVRAVASELRDGTRSYRQVRSVSTDDQGRYRMWNFTPGEYYIATAGRTGGTVATVTQSLSAGAGGPVAFAPVYFPGARDRASATAIVMTPGQDVTADLRVRMEASFRIRGTIRGAAAYQPVQVELLRGANDLNATRALVNSATGRFEVREVVPGNYLLRATQGAGTQQFRGEVPVQVAGKDLSGVVLDLAPGVSVTGVVRMPAAASARPERKRMRGTATVTLQAVGDAAGAKPWNAMADEEGRFAIEGVAQGRYHLQVMPFGGYVAAAISGTQDLLQGELVVGAGTAPAAIEIDVRDDGGVVNVQTAEVQGTVLLAAPNGGETQHAPAMQGGVQFGSLAPGEYQVYWLKEIDRLEYRNADVLRMLRGGTRVTLTAKGSASVVVKEMAQ
jgi:hypothetical protein